MKEGFQQTLDNYDFTRLNELSRCEDVEVVRQHLASAKYPKTGLETFALLISPAASHLLEEMAQKSSQLTSERHGKVIRLYAPAYISNECTNTCTYCGFTMENKINRKSLDANEMKSEAEYLNKRGFRQLLIVSGEHQKIVTSEYVCSMVEQSRPYFSSVAIETAPFKTHEYEALVTAGVDSLTLYQETYDRETYAAVHLRGKKKDYDYRLAAPERGGEARMRKLNMGVLLGLSPDWRLDSIKCALHLDWMMKKYWRMQYAISLPRLCESETDYQPAVEVQDKEIVQLVMAWRLAFPDLSVNISTREPDYLRDGLIGLGVTHMSAESSTEPGGYCTPDTALKQFDITDERSVDEVIQIIESRGHEAVWKDWDPCMLG
jgi:2-iminoacetate synthase